MFPYILAASAFLCLWLTWTSTASTRASLEARSMSVTTTNHARHTTRIEDRIQDHSNDTVVIDNDENRLERIVASMVTLAKKNSHGATCNHTVVPSVEWVVAAQTSTSKMRWTVPLQHLLEHPGKLIVGNNDEEITFHVCRRDCCVAGGACLEETFVLPPSAARTTGATNSTTTHNSTTQRTCVTPSDIRKSLDNGAWKAQPATTTKRMSGGETWFSPECTMPTAVTLPPSNKKKQQRILFVGDSTLQEIALMVAHGAGSSRNTPIALNKNEQYHLNCKCEEAIQVGTTKDCRMFDATGPSLNVSMMWSGHSQCNGNRMGVNVVDDMEWRTSITNKVQAQQPEFVFFQVPLSHSCTDIHSCVDALRRYICFFTTFAHTRPVLMITGAAIGRQQSQGPTGRHCPSHLRRWVNVIYREMEILAPDIAILDIFNPTERYIDLMTSGPRGDPFRPACRSMERHLTCDFTNVDDFSTALESPFYILPPGRLAGAAVMQMLSTKDVHDDAEMHTSTGGTCDVLTAATRAS